MQSSIKDRLILVFLDLLGSQIAFWVWTNLRFKTFFNPIDIIPSVIFSLFWLMLFTLLGLYDRPNWETSKLDEFINLIKAAFLGILIIFFLVQADLTKVGLYIYGGSLILCVFLFRLIYRGVVKRMRVKGIWLRNSVIIGQTPEGIKLEKNLKANPELGYRVIGFVTPRGEGQKAVDNLPVLGHLEALARIVKEHNVQEILIAYSSKEHDFILKIMGYCASYPVEFKIIPDFYDLISGHKTTQIHGVPLIKLFPEPFNLLQRVAKRIIDIIIPWAVVLSLAPLWIVVMVAIKLDSPGPVLFRQIRVGKHGRRFTCYKFRSMHKDAEKNTGPVWASRGDPRITRVGRFLRISRLDEIPQFINVLRGEMSLVGPRPERPHFVRQLRQEFPLYMKRLNIKPGITGWAQVKHKYDVSLDDVREKLKYDLYYIENFSLLFDIKIIARTAWVALTGHGAH
ncbi:undecaprenyl-phosphate glucose phosphotransferase [bacterium]|nr:undecaprenyl-phosphate glucose phosphotransferase [bacterium]